jgi:hypothetical protein
LGGDRLTTERPTVWPKPMAPRYYR